MTKHQPFLILKKQQLTEQQQIKMNKTSYFYINGPFYIFEVDNVIIIYNLYNDLLLSLQLETYNNNNITAKEMIFKKPKKNCIFNLPRAFAE